MAAKITDKNGSTINVNDSATITGTVTSIDPAGGTVTVKITQANGQSISLTLNPATITRGEPII